MAIINLIKRKYIILILSGIFFSLLFMGFKYVTGSSYTIAPKGDVEIAKTIKLENYSDRYDILRYDKYLSSSAFLHSFYESSKENYDYDKLSPGWSNKTQSEKMQWLNKHIIVTYFGAGRMEAKLSIKRSEPINLQYIKENGEKFLDDFINFANDKDPFGQYEIVNSEISIPEGLVVSSKKVILKYGIIGFVLGIVFMLTIILVWNMYKGNYGRN